MISSHKIDTPSSKRPVLVIKSQGYTPLDEEGNENLYSLNDFLNGWIRQKAAPYLKIPSLACIALEKFAGRLPVFRGSVVLDVRIEDTNLFKCDWTSLLVIPLLKPKPQDYLPYLLVSNLSVFLQYPLPLYLQRP